ncbi:MAG TPA: fibronectin type III domain-containing protein [Candidatus Saccharimonadales bacterium]|nr:fibronectin type III domain-containing protein [Candidatus Saccharimonadales bacterium]
MNIQHNKQKTKFLIHMGQVMLGLAIFGGTVWWQLLSSPAVYAACQPSGAIYGADSLSVTIPTTSTYAVWTRLQAPSSSADSIMLEIDGNNCYSIGGSSAMSANTWTWVNYVNGNTSNTLTVSLGQGTHTFKLIGVNAGVAVDLLMLLDSSNGCVPTGFGTNCMPAPTPTVSFTTPAPGATVGGNVTVSASAAVSASTISTINLTAAGTTLQTCHNTSTCSATWDTTALSNGAYALGANATASNGNSGAASESVTVANSSPGGSTTISAPAYITSPTQTTSSISLSWDASTDSKYPNSQLTYQIYRDGIKVGTTTQGSTSFNDTGLRPGTYYSYTLTATDPAGNVSPSSAALSQNTKTPNCPAPAAPSGLTAQATGSTSAAISWQPVANPSSSCVVTGYIVSRDGVPIAQLTTPDYNDNGLTANTTYTYAALAIVTGNITGTPASVHVTTPTPQQPDPGPTAPTNLSAIAVSSTQINLSWSPSSDGVAGIKNYTILRNGQAVGTATATSFGDTDLRAGTPYSYRVVANSGEDKTTLSASVNMTTLASVSSSGESNTAIINSIPLLRGTRTVGSGSENGASISQNPTAANAATVLLTEQIGQGTPAKRLAARRVAYIGSGTVSVLVVGVAVWLWLMRKQRHRIIAIDDSDLRQQIVISPPPNRPDTISPSNAAKPADKDPRL